MSKSMLSLLIVQMISELESMEANEGCTVGPTINVCVDIFCDLIRQPFSQNVLR